MIRNINKNYIYLGILLLLIIVATTISSSFSRDTANYIRMFEAYGSSGWGSLPSQVFQREAFLLIVSKFFYQFGLSPVFLFLTFSVLSLSVKFYLIDVHSKDKWLSLALFSAYFFILHDSTQIRFSLAVAFVYLALHYLSAGRKLLFAAIVFSSAVMFHTSALVFLVMLFFTSRKSLSWLLTMIVVAVLLYSVNLHAVLLSLVEDAIAYFELHRTFLNKLHNYMLRPSQSEHLGMLKPTMILVYACAVVLYQYRKKFSTYESLCYSALLLTIFFYILLHNVVDLQIRFRDMFFFSLVFLIPYIHDWVSKYVSKRVAYALLLMAFSVYLVKFIFYDKMLML
ncbi:MAG: EpsG family protein [Gammaproteobacteria bacterium]|nr:EpsG family protein [Gammaproteobacteria bacterium]